MTMLSARASQLSKSVTATSVLR